MAVAREWQSRASGRRARVADLRSEVSEAAAVCWRVQTHASNRRQSAGGSRFVGEYAHAPTCCKLGARLADTGMEAVSRSSNQHAVVSPSRTDVGTAGPVRSDHRTFRRRTAVGQGVAAGRLAEARHRTAPPLDRSPRLQPAVGWSLQLLLVDRRRCCCCHSHHHRYNIARWLSQTRSWTACQVRLDGSSLTAPPPSPSSSSDGLEGVV